MGQERILSEARLSREYGSYNELVVELRCGQRLGSALVGLTPFIEQQAVWEQISNPSLVNA